MTIAYACIAAVAAGGAVLAAVLRGYRLEARVTLVPAAPKDAPRAAAAPAKVATRKAAAEPAPLAAVPDGETVTRKEAAQMLRVSHSTVKRLGQRRVLINVPHPGRETCVTRESVERYLQARDKAA
jgi:excisionase family DNA binding protein